MPKTKAKTKTQTAPEKRVRITLELDSQFIRLLNANVNLSGAMMSTLKGDPTRQLSPKEVLAIMILGEARGATEEQLHAALPLEWRSNLELIHNERRVYQQGKLIAGPSFYPGEPQHCLKHGADFETSKCPLCATGK